MPDEGFEPGSTEEQKSERGRSNHYTMAPSLISFIETVNLVYYELKSTDYK